MSIQVPLTTTQKQSVVVELRNVDGSLNVTDPVGIYHAPNPPTAYTIQPGLNNRHFLIVAAAAGAGVVTFAGPTGKTDTANVDVSAPADQSSCIVALDGGPTQQ